MTTYATLEDVGRAVAALLPRPNPILPAIIATDLGLVNGTPLVLVNVAGARRQAVYPIPRALRLGGACWVTRTGPHLTAPLMVIATNYQVVPGRPSSGAGDTIDVPDGAVVDADGAILLDTDGAYLVEV